MLKNRAYKYRFYPTKDQKQILAKTFGCVRYVYNWGLQLKRETYRNEGQKLSYNDLSKRLTALKRQKEMVWLCEVSSVPLQQSLRHLDTAFTNFFQGRAKYPTFHTKHQKQSATFASNAFTWDGKHLTLGKGKKGEPLNIRWTVGKRDKSGKRARHIFREKPTSITVSMDAAGRYFVSFTTKEEIPEAPKCEREIGIDLGLKDAVILSTGEKVGNPRFFRKDEKKLARTQRSFARKQKGSKNQAKAKRKVARIHARIADRRNDFIHKLTTKLIDENQVIAVESLRVKNMMNNHHLAKSIADVGWGELVRQLEYKAQWYGRTVVKIDTFYPSSKTCSKCGHVMDEMPLQVRQWICPECHTQHDRDINAARNVLAAGHAVIACGESVRPTRQRRTRRVG